MSLIIDTEIPPVFNGIIQIIHEKEEVITKKELEKALINLRISKEQAKEIIKWMHDKGLITRVEGRKTYYMIP